MGYASPMRLDAFLGKFIEGYLFSDLETMKGAGPASPAADGHLGYPMFTAFASGVELLGFLMSDGTDAFKARRPYQNFVSYWTEYLYPDEPRRGAGMSIFQLIRNGVAHAFVAKAPTVAKRGPHLVNVEGVVRVDAVQLADDLKASYYSHVRRVVDGESGRRGETFASMQERLDEMLRSYEQDYVRHRSGLDALPPSSAVSPLDTLNSGATDDVRTVSILLDGASFVTQSYEAVPSVGASSVGHGTLGTDTPKK
jgi:hypothetical protein